MSKLDALAELDTGEHPIFTAPWQARAFAIAVALSEDEAYEWKTFQERLVAMIDRESGPTVPSDREEGEDVYYNQWLMALEELLVSDGYIEPGELVSRTNEFAAGDRDASEWVSGEHSHDHEHPHDHSHSH